MLKLERRPISEFLGLDHQQALEQRAQSARSLADEATLTSSEKSKRIGSRWDDFRAGRTSKGTFDALWRELQRMSFEKCAFCETPAPNTVEHLEEKSRAPAMAFEWKNLLAACGACNLHRENSALVASPIDPSAVDPLDYFGWDEYGNFAPAPAHRDRVLEHVRMYGLRRLQGARREKLQAVRALLASAAVDDVLRDDVVEALREMLTATSVWLGPVREYLLKPPSEDDALLLDEALRRLPAIRTWVEPWLRPPEWASARWQ